jgi:hypothetical protein
MRMRTRNPPKAGASAGIMNETGICKKNIIKTLQRVFGPKGGSRSMAARAPPPL